MTAYSDTSVTGDTIYHYRVYAFRSSDTTYSGYSNVDSTTTAIVTAAIAFETDRDGNREIYVMDANGNNQTNLTTDNGPDYGANWSPDGTQIAFWSIRDGNNEVYIMDADGSNVQRLTNHNAIDFWPDWSPDGTQIAFESEQDINARQIWVMNADGSNPVRITNTVTNEKRPAWSPDGTQIAFHSNRDGHNEIYVMNADGSNQTRLTNNSTNFSNPAWSPDGTQIAFDSENTATDEIYVIDVDGNNLHQLTNNSGSVRDLYPEWSPDGTQIFWLTNRDGNWEIYVMNADGTNPINLTNNSALDQSPASRPIGTPSDLTATPVSSTQVDLTWVHNNVTETAFFIERSLDGSTSWAEVGTVDADVTTYSDTTACGITYYYRVRAFRSGDAVYSIYSNVDNALSGGCGIQVNTTSMTVVDDGFCSLIEAINAANTDMDSGGAAGECVPVGGSDIIWLQVGQTYTLTAIHNLSESSGGPNGLPLVSSTITINGNGSTITRVAVSDFRIFYVSATGDLTLTNMTVSNGAATNTGFTNGNSGGGIFNVGTLTIINSTLSGNNASYLGGGITISGPNTVSINNSTLSGNNASHGGGIWSTNSGTLTINNSTLSGNNAGYDGGGIRNSGGPMTISNSTIIDNSARDGGGIYNTGTLAVNNSTLSGNTASASGGAIINGTNSMTINNSTIVDNSASAGSSGIDNSATLEIKNSIVANDPTQSNCLNTGIFTAYGDNLDTDGTCVALSANFTTSVGINLQPLVGNGGPTLTHALGVGSSAIDAATDCTLVDGVTTVTEDQRGVTRPQGTACDVGAYEY